MRIDFTIPSTSDGWRMRRRSRFGWAIFSPVINLPGISFLIYLRTWPPRVNIQRTLTDRQLDRLISTGKP